MTEIATILPFRVHFEDGSTFDIDADDANAARKAAKTVANDRQTIIKKVKIRRGDD